MTEQSIPPVHYSGPEAKVLSAKGGGFLVVFTDPDRGSRFAENWSEVISYVISSLHACSPPHPAMFLLSHSHMPSIEAHVR